MKLYGTPPTRALRVLWLLNELDVDCEVITVDMEPANIRAPSSGN